MSSRYVAISHAEFSRLMAEMKFSQIALEGTLEYVYEHVIDAPKHGVPTKRFAVRIYSSIDMRTNWTRETGEDAIRVCLMDIQQGRGERSFTRVHRTRNAMPNLRERARDAYRMIINRDATFICPRCGSLMVERKSTRAGKTERFLACTGFRRDDPASCKYTQPVAPPAAKKVA